MRPARGADAGSAPDYSYRGKHLQLTFTVEDPAVFTTPWSATVTFGKPAADWEWPEAICAENPNKYGTEEDAQVPTVCSSLEQALEYLDKDREFLTRGGVFTDDWINSYIDLKMEEVTKMRMTPHPIEFGMYYSC